MFHRRGHFNSPTEGCSKASQIKMFIELKKKRKTLFVKEKFLMRFSFGICKLEDTTKWTVLFVQEKL
jgi:hypothetical protein